MTIDNFFDKISLGDVKYMKCLLLGNGLNIANHNDYLMIDNVRTRFLSILKSKYKLFEKCLCIDSLNYEDLKDSILKDNNGIEQLSGNLFDYFYNLLKINNKFCWNDCFRLIELIASISIESLFIVDGKYKKPIISIDYENKIKKYDKVFTLNYVEDWDKENKCIYLHGNINNYLSNYRGQNIISNILKYSLHLEAIPTNYLELDFSDIIFIPDNKIVDKHSYVGEGLFCGKCGLPVYPSDDLFLDSGKGDIYEKLNHVEYIDIFGMSPYGDKSLIDKISYIKNVTIYVHNMNSDEIKEWKKYLSNAKFKDSKEFITANN